MYDETCEYLFLLRFGFFSASYKSQICKPTMHLVEQVHLQVKEKLTYAYIEAPIP